MIFYRCVTGNHTGNYFLITSCLSVKLHNKNRKRESGHVIVMEFPVHSGTTISSVTQGKQHNAIFVTQTIPLARIVL